MTDQFASNLRGEICNVVVWSFVLCSKKVMCKLFEAKIREATIHMLACCQASVNHVIIWGSSPDDWYVLVSFVSTDSLFVLRIDNRNWRIQILQSPLNAFFLKQLLSNKILNLETRLISAPRIHSIRNIIYHPISFLNL
jgi:hypothetical protein